MPRLNPQLLRRDIAESGDEKNLALPPISERTAALADSIVEGAPRTTTRPSACRSSWSATTAMTWAWTPSPRDVTP